MALRVSPALRLRLRPRRRLLCQSPAARRRHTTSCGNDQNQFISQHPSGRAAAPRDGAQAQSASAHEPFTLAIKDNIATSWLATTCASRILANHESAFEATIVRQLRARGAIVVGKTNMDEFGMGSLSTNTPYGPVTLPPPETGGADDAGGTPPPPRRAAGGSSGGSAVAVATGQADVALGTDTGGSVRLPAAYAGVVGYKPSYGMLSRWGVVPYANSLDTVGLMAKDVRRIRNLVFGGGGGGSGLDREHDARDPTSLSINARERCRRAAAEASSSSSRELTIGVPLEYNVDELDPMMRAAWLQMAERIVARTNGAARVVPVSLPMTRHALSAYYVLAPAEASSNLAKYDGVRYGPSREWGAENNDRDRDRDGTALLYTATRGEGFGAEVRRRILLGTYTLSSDAIDNYFIQAQRVRRLVQRDFDRVFARANPLYDEADQRFDLEAVDGGVAMADKLGPEQVDFLLTPTAPTFAPTLDEAAGFEPVQSYMNDVFTVPASLAGVPAVTVPVTVPAETRHAGLQLIGQYWDDERLLELAEKLQ